MERYTQEQRVHIIKIYYMNGCSIKTTHRRLRDFFGARNRPSELAIRNLIRKFEATGSVRNRPLSGRPKSVRTNENIARVRESVENEPRMSIPRRSQILGIARTSVWRILHRDLNFYAYKIQLTQELKERDHLQRRNFVNWVLEHRAVDNHFARKIIFSDEAHFTLHGHVNKHNCRIWGAENPRVIQEQPLHAQKVTVWCAFWSGGVIGAHFFEDGAGNTVTVNAQRYQEMLLNFLWPRLDEIDINNLYFQHDGATSHTTRENIALLRTRFPGRTISRNGDINWPPRSCDLTPLDFFLWGHLKERVYGNNPQTLDDLKNNIRQAIREIDLAVCQKVIDNFDVRIDACQRSRGGHLNDIIFHV